MIALPVVSTEIINVTLASLLLAIAVCQYLLIWKDSLGSMAAFVIMMLTVVVKSLLDEILNPAAGLWLSLIMGLFLSVFAFNATNFLVNLLMLLVTFIVSMIVPVFFRDAQLKVLSTAL